MKDYDVYSSFDLEKHKQTFRDYLEAVILKDGTVEYAVPSHTEKLISLTGIERETLYDMIPVNASPLEWLLSYTGCVCVWSRFYLGTPTTSAQEKTLQLLLDEGLTLNR